MIRKRNNSVLLALFASIFILVLGTVAFVFFSNEPAKNRTRPFVIGAIRLSEVDDRTLAGFKDGLKEQGFNLNSDIVIRDTGPAGTIDKLDDVVADHLAAGVDMIFVSSTPGALAVKRATAGTSIPVIFTPVNDPVASGVVDNLERPGGNITGIKLPLGDDVRLLWLLKLAPATTHVFIPFTEQDKSSMQSVSVVRDAASKLNIELMVQAVSSTDEAREAARSIPAQANAIYIPRDSGVEAGIDAYVQEALKLKLPISAPSSTQVEAGALFCFGFVHHELGKQGAIIASKIIHGAEPATTPIEVGRSYLTLNLQTAKAIGMSIPDDIVRQAAIVIK